MNADRLLALFEQISEAPDAILRMRRFILDLAVRGKLVEQDPEDEPAEELLKRLKPAKVLAYEVEGLRSRQPVSRVNRDDLWFEISPGWALPCFDDVFVIISGVTKGQRIPPSEAVDVPYLRVANVQRGSLDLSQVKTIGVRAADVERYRLKDQDILMTEGGDWDKLGRAAIWANQIQDCIHQNHVFRLRVPSDGLIPDWVVLYSNSDPGRKFFENCSKQTTNLASINMTQLRSCPLPLPPLAEQHRIVAKVDELMALCDQLEQQLSQADQQRRGLLEAVLAEVLAEPETALASAASVLAG
jgi:type I restriction enzyme S subunit